MTEQGWTIAGRYRVLGRIGAGGMADVLRAHDEMLDRDVAVKVFRSVVSGPDGTTDTAKGVERQRAELAALARLNHPNLTMLYDGSIVGQQGPAYLVMELIDGPSLAQAIADGGLTESQARVVGAQIGDALAYVHTAGMVHRDVKPANILLGSDRNSPNDGVRARLTDFGIVRLVGSEPLTQADMTLGSASYLAPEQARGSAVGPPADIYALGLTLIEALTGRRSFDGPALEAVVARLTNDPEIPAGFPEPWPSLLRAMTARDPAHRPTAARVASTLRGSGSLTAPITSVPAATYDTAILPAAVAAASYAPPPRRPADPPTGSRTAARPIEPGTRRWSASLIIAGILVLALIVAGIALVLANSGGGGGAGSPTAPAPSPSKVPSRSSSAAPHKHRSNSPTHSHAPPSAKTSEAPPSEPSSPETTPTTPSSTPPTKSSTSSTPSTSAPRTSASSSPTASRTRTSNAAAGAVAVTPTPSTSRSPA